jgi:hypothetical protein
MYDKLHLKSGSLYGFPRQFTCNLKDALKGIYKKYYYKNNYNKRHAKLRALQRYGVKLTTDDFREIGYKIRTGNMIKLSEENNTIWCIVELYGIKFSLLYHKRRGVVLTFFRKRSIGFFSQIKENKNEI